MGKTAFIFPGQGSQYSGMGKETYDAFSCARDAFDEATNALGISLPDLCFKSSEAELKLTHNTQPAILTVSVAVLRVIESRGLRPDFVAGHSLGEYSALVCAGAITLTEAAKLVRKRGKYMQEAVPPGQGAMAAILGLDAKQVCEACFEAGSAGVVSPANFNSPDQTVISGDQGAVRLASEKAREKGARRVMPLPVSAPFHCELMSPARDRLSADLQSVNFSDLRMPLVTNVDAAPILTGGEAKEALIRQVCAPVRWVETIQLLLRCGVETFIEVGPGKVLAGLVRNIAPQVQTHNVDGIRGIEALASVLAGGTM
jgi:[acyl-carrier-protein] S-malonyltransferase